ncbi:MAG: right-handed parallel beta-helix repeat-containing protein [candidate division Zixibacteria bacterium]
MKFSVPYSFFFAAVFIIAGCDSDDDKITPPPVINDHIIRVPGNEATFQAAINEASDGDTILVADGVYQGFGNRDITFNGKDIVIKSENGPRVTVIDCQADSFHQHLAFDIEAKEDGIVIDGFTIRNGNHNNGGAIEIRSSSPTIRNCIFKNNTAPVSGGAIRAKGGDPVIENCTFYGNSSIVGGAIYVIAGASPPIRNCIIAFSTQGGAVLSSDGTSIPQISCTNIFGNSGGDWIDRIAPQADSSGNLNLDPIFCDTALSVFNLLPTSPCAPANNSCGELIGALNAGCQ